MTLIEDLQATKDFLVSHEWGQGFSSERPGTYCVWQAVIEVVRPGSYDDVDDALARALRPSVWRDPVIFNDAPGRTKDEVLALIDRAIIAEEARSITDVPKVDGDDGQFGTKPVWS